LYQHDAVAVPFEQENSKVFNQSIITQDQGIEQTVKKDKKSMQD